MVLIQLTLFTHLPEGVLGETERSSAGQKRVFSKADSYRRSEGAYASVDGEENAGYEAHGLCHDLQYNG